MPFDAPHFVAYNNKAKHMESLFSRAANLHQRGSLILLKI